MYPDPLWERACSGRRSDDSGLSGGINVECEALIASKLAPTTGKPVRRYQSMYSNNFTIFCTPETPCTRLVARAASCLVNKPSR